jgi:hypothetical protein
MKSIKFRNSWGDLEFIPDNNRMMLISFSGPRGGLGSATRISSLEALALAEYLRVWALAALEAAGHD